MARLSMPHETSRSSLVTVRGVSKRFAAAWALNQVDLALQEGEIHALCGENGAGKSTLIQILGGVFRPDAGRIEIDGKEVRFRDPSAALEEGIGIIYQELNLVEPFTIAENLALGHEPRLGPWIDRRGLDRRARSLLEDLGFDLDPRDLVAGLTIGQRQQVEIAKAPGRRVRILILDEPTAALSRAETDRLFHVLRDLRTRGLAILYVSHHLEEVFAADEHPDAGEHRRGAGPGPGLRADRGGFDLPQGAILALSAAATGHLAQRGVSPVVAAAAALAIGALRGSINGVMVSAVRTNPFVTTLSTLLIFRGAAFIVLRGQPLSNLRIFQAIDSGFRLGSTFVPYRGVFFLALTVLSWLVLRQTRLRPAHLRAGGQCGSRAPCRDQDCSAPHRDVRPERPRRGRGHDPLPVLAARGQTRHCHGVRA